MLIIFGKIEKSLLFSPTAVTSLSFDAIPQIVQVPPEAAAGSKVATVRILIDKMILNNASSLSLWNIYANNVLHNNSGRLQWRYHSTHPLFKLVPSNNPSYRTISYSHYTYFSSTAFAELREVSPVTCTINSHSYIAISLDVVLLSNSLYHLGDYPIRIEARLLYNNSYYRVHTITTLRVKAG